MYGKYFVLFAILFTGWFLRRINFIDDKMNHSINKLIVYFAYPCLIVHNIGSLEMDRGVVVEFLLTFAISLACFYIYGGVCRLYTKLRRFPDDKSGIAEFSMTAPNDGFMGFPVAMIFFGDKGLLLMLAHNAAMNFFVFTYGLVLLRRNVGDGRNGQRSKLRSFIRAALKLMVNPNILALVIGFAISLSPFGIPAAVDEYLLYIGNISTPMAMIFIGSSLAGYRFADIIKSRITIESSLMKLIWLPLITAALVYFLPVGPMIKCIACLGCCFPAAATVSMLAEQEGQDAGVASKILFLSTVLSIATIPAAINMLTLLFM